MLKFDSIVILSIVAFPKLSSLVTSSDLYHGFTKHINTLKVLRTLLAEKKQKTKKQTYFSGISDHFILKNIYQHFTSTLG